MHWVVGVGIIFRCLGCSGVEVLMSSPAVGITVLRYTIEFFGVLGFEELHYCPF